MREPRLRVGELCAGYGGLGLAVEWVMGAETAWLAEIDPAARRVLAAHWPDVPLYGDITAIDWTTVPRVDVLAGGTESSFSPGKELLPTPTAYLGSCGGAQPPEKRRAGGHQVHLHDMIEHLLPTPTARDWRDGEEPPSAVPVNALLGRTIWHLPEGYDLPPGHAGLAEAWIPTAPPAGST